MNSVRVPTKDDQFITLTESKVNLPGRNLTKMRPAELSWWLKALVATMKGINERAALRTQQRTPHAHRPFAVQAITFSSERPHPTVVVVGL